MTAIDTAVSPWNTKDDEPATDRVLRVADCTLRDGEQQAGLVFAKQDKIELARMLAAIGVDDLELGTPAVSTEDREAIEEIVDLRLGTGTSALARAREQDIDVVKQCGVDAVRVSLPIGPRQRAAKLPLSDDDYVAAALRICTYAKGIGLDVIFSPYDTTRCDLPLLERLLGALHAEGCADRVRLVDTAGAAAPEAIRHLVTRMHEAGHGIPIEVHCHNDLGLATANTVAGARAGAAYVSVTVNGIGERSGNAALEEVVMALTVLYGMRTRIDTTRLSELSAAVQERSKVALQPHKAVVGANAFSHESGTVVAGVLADPFTAEPYSPGAVGRERRILVGKKSGAKSVEWKLQELGIEPTKELVSAVLPAVKSQAIEAGRALSDDEVRAIASAAGA